MTCPRSHGEPEPAWSLGQVHSGVTFRPYRCVACSQLALAPLPTGVPISPCERVGQAPRRDGPGRKPADSSWVSWQLSLHRLPLPYLHVEVTIIIAVS